jgi:phage gpG-like protein
MKIKITIQGSDKVKKELNKIMSRLSDFSSDFQAMGVDLVRFYSTIPFVSRGSVYGGYWTPLNKAYEAWKAKKYPGRPILVRTGKMQQSFKADHTKRSLKIYNSVEYFKKHQLGEGVPQRRMLGVNPQIIAIIKDSLTKSIKAKVNSV